MNPPSIRLAFGAVFWRIFLILTVLVEFRSWRIIRQMLPGRWRHRRLAAWLFLTPGLLFRAFAIAAIVTILLDQLVRLLAWPIAARWYFPAGAGSEQTPLGFHLDASEQIVAEAPARRRAGGGWRPGTLVLTTRTLWFFPVAWDLEPWSLPLDHLGAIRSIPYRPLFGTFVRGVPDRLVVRHDSGEETAFAVADPRVVRDWFDRPDLAQYLHSRSAELESSLRESHDV